MDRIGICESHVGKNAESMYTHLARSIDRSRVALSHCVFASFVDLLTFGAPLLRATQRCFFCRHGWSLFRLVPSACLPIARRLRARSPMLGLMLPVCASDGVYATCPHCKDSTQGCTGGDKAIMAMCTRLGAPTYTLCALYCMRRAPLARGDNAGRSARRRSGSECSIIAVK